MPLRLRLKKTRRYNVSGKNSFVAKVQLLDNGFMEITLTPESLGQDCLDTIAQKLQLEESIYFGLQYSNKNYKLRWVDLEKPLKKQLDKNAHESQLRLGVMLYTNSTHTLRHEMTRYMYYLQLKSDIVEGILPCSVDQAVSLASLAAQAEIGNFDPAKHTVEFLQQHYVLLPKNMTPDSESLSELLMKVLHEYQARAGMSTMGSELAYIEHASKLEGYGQESFPAKDESGNELFISASFTGLIVKHLNRQETVHFQWHEVVSMGHNRRAFGIGRTGSHDMLQFHMEDAETAKYVCRICKLQQQFHKYTVETVKLGSREVLVDGFPDEQVITVVDRERSPSMEGHPMSGGMSSGNRDSIIMGEGTSSDESLPHQQMMMDRQMSNQQFIISTGGNNTANFTTSQLSLDNQHPYDIGPFTTSQLSLDRPPNDYSYSNGNLVMLDQHQNGSVYSAPSINSLNYGGGGPYHQQVSPDSSNPSLAANLQTSLPAYRQSPDYEALIQSRLQQRLLTVSEQSQSLSNLGQQQPNGYAHHVEQGMLYPQAELRQHNGRTRNNHYRQQFRLSYGGISTNYSNALQNIDFSLESLQHGLLVKTPHGNIVHTISVPELTSEHIPTTEEYITAKLLKNKFKPPPPYPRGSASTPNLARQSSNMVTSSSPDLVSRRLQAIEAIDRAEELNSYGNGNMQMHSDLSQSLPIEAFQQLRIQPHQDYLPNVGVYSRHMGQAYPQQQYSPTQRTEYNPSLTLSLADKARPSDLSILGVPTGYEDNLPSPPIDQNRLMNSFPDYSMSVVSPPSEFADHSDIDSNLSPGSVGSPHHFQLPPPGMGEAFYLSNSQLSLPENSVAYNPAAYSHQVNGQATGSPTRVYSMPQLHPEMREVNPGHYAMLHVDQLNHVNYVNSTLPGFHNQLPHNNTDMETVLAGMPNHQHPGSPTRLSRSPNQVPESPRMVPDSPNKVLDSPGQHSRSPNNHAGSPVVIHSSPQQMAHFDPSPMAGIDIIQNQFPQQEQYTQTPEEPNHLVAEPSLELHTQIPSASSVLPVISTSTSVPPSHSKPIPSTSKASEPKTDHAQPSTSDRAGRVTVATSSKETAPDESLDELTKDGEGYIGPLKLAAMSGLTLLRPRDMPSDQVEESKHPRDARRKILEKQLREGQVFTEYEQITKKKAGVVCYTASLPDNVKRNRFKDVLPYEDCRVELSGSKENSGGYINASTIKVPIAGEMLHYIAAQSPTKSTASDWWRMVWEQGTQVIAMLTKLEEGGKEKCFRYWPDCTSPKKNTAEFGPFRVIGQFSNDSGGYITSGLTLRHIPSGEQRTVWHLQYTDWPNQGCPNDVHGFLSFLEEFQSVCRHANSMNEKEVGPPPVVHCSAGVGRTGVLLLTDVMISSLEHNEEINIPKMLSILRQQRMLMVQTVGQYSFVYKALIESLRNTRLV